MSNHSFFFLCVCRKKCVLVRTGTCIARLRFEGTVALQRLERRSQNIAAGQYAAELTVVINDGKAVLLVGQKYARGILEACVL
mmetsp:Transcript_647/g.1353  ORF Transcript_647/g.1353 Transcript_647/m.1353 type:complete len:83 (-) Transcript_647:520-768(-)